MQTILEYIKKNSASEYKRFYLSNGRAGQPNGVVFEYNGQMLLLAMHDAFPNGKSWTYVQDKLIKHNWRMPTEDEWKFISYNSGDINDILVSGGGTILADKPYWSCTKSGDKISIVNPATGKSFKTALRESSFGVRFIKKID